MDRATAMVFLDEVRAKAGPPFRVFGPPHLYGIIAAGLRRGEASAIRITKLFVITYATLGIIMQSQGRFAIRIHLHGPEPWRNQLFLGESRYLSQARDAKRTVSLRPGPISEEMLKQYDSDFLEQVWEIVRSLEDLPTDDLIYLSYRALLGPAHEDGQYIRPEALAHGIIGTSLAHNLHWYERNVLRDRARRPQQLRLPLHAQALPTSALIVNNDLTCLKDGTANRALCLAAVALLARRGYGVGSQGQHLLALLSCYYTRSLRLARAIKRQLSKGTLADPNPARAALMDHEAQIHGLEEKALPKLQTMLADLEVLGLAHHEGTHWVPTVNQLVVLPDHAIIDLDAICDQAENHLKTIQQWTNERIHRPRQPEAPWSLTRPTAPVLHAPSVDDEYG